MTASLLGAVPALAQTIRTTIRVGEPYRGSGVEFQTMPRMSVIPGTQVYYVRDDAFDNDLYRYNGRWYYVEDGNWYESRSWRGPFRYTLRTTVPRAVVSVPAGYRRSWTVVNDREWDDGDRTYRDRDGRNIYRGTALSFRVEPRMRLIPRTRVYYIGDGSDTDLYRVRNTWYFVENGDWYRAASWRGPFMYVRWSDLPRSVRTVPTRYRRNWTYTSGPTWRDDNDDRWRESSPVVRVGDRYRGTFTLSREPRMSIIPGTDVTYSRDEADFDLYRYGSSWYLVDGGAWYRAGSWRGPFVRIRESMVPNTVFRIPAGYRKTWVSPID